MQSAHQCTPGKQCDHEYSRVEPTHHAVAAVHTLSTVTVTHLSPGRSVKVDGRVPCRLLLRRDRRLQALDVVRGPVVTPGHYDSVTATAWHLGQLDSKGCTAVERFRVHDTSGAGADSRSRLPVNSPHFSPSARDAVPVVDTGVGAWVVDRPRLRPGGASGGLVQVYKSQALGGNHWRVTGAHCGWQSSCQQGRKGRRCNRCCSG